MCSLYYCGGRWNVTCSPPRHNSHGIVCQRRRIRTQRRDLGERERDESRGWQKSSTNFLGRGYYNINARRMKVYAKEKELVKYIRAEFKERFFQERWDLSFICISYKGALSSALFLLTKQDGATISQQPLLNAGVCFLTFCQQFSLK